MNTGHLVPLALVVAAIVAIAGYAWVAARCTRVNSDFLLVAIVALIASCTARPSKAAPPVIIVVQRPAVVPSARPAPAPARSAPTTEPVRPAPVVVPVVPARPACTDERRARKECS